MFVDTKILLFFVLGEVMVCVLDFKRDVGLWHGILCVSMNISYKLGTFAPCQLEVKPLLWCIG